MIDNTFIWVDGSPTSGKTTLIERVLQSNRSRNLGAVRFRKNNKLREPKVIAKGNDETRRYQNAGADNTLLIEYPDNDETSVADYFWSSGFLAGMYNAIYCEAELTNDQFPMDLNIFVLPALADPSSIFQARQYKVDEDLMRRYFAQSLGHLAPAMDKFSISFDDCVDEVLAKTEDEMKALPPLTILRLAPGFEGLIVASAIVVNIKDETERSSAERLLNYINEVGSQPRQIENTFGYFWRPKRSMFIANLSNPKDAELKKALAMIKRRFVER